MSSSKELSKLRLEWNAQYAEGKVIHDLCDEIARLQAALLIAENERDKFKQQRADWKAIADSRPHRAASEPREIPLGLRECCQDFDNCEQHCILLIRTLRGRAAQPPDAVHEFSIGDEVMVNGYPAKVLGFIPTYRIQFDGKSGWVAVQEMNLERHTVTKGAGQ